MTFEAAAAALTADVDTFADFAPAAVELALPANDPADPETGWATRNPSQAMVFLFVSPRDCAAVGELMAA
jgi:hypothetical protein